MGYSFHLAARVLLYASSHRLDSTYHSRCCTSRGALAGTRNSSKGPPWHDLIHMLIWIYSIFLFQGLLVIAINNNHNMFNRRKEGNVLFNDALNTFYLLLYGVGHMVKDHSDSERETCCRPHRLLFLMNSKGSFIYTIPQTG